MRLIWLTRGKNWGFRFLRDGGMEDPLPTYEEAFLGTSNDNEDFRTGKHGIALRFPDPEGRKDRSGRVILHNFVILDTPRETIESLEDGVRQVWPLVEQEYRDLWDSAV